MINTKDKTWDDHMWPQHTATHLQWSISAAWMPRLEATPDSIGPQTTTQTKFPERLWDPNSPKSSKLGCFPGYTWAPSPAMSRHRPGLLEWCVTRRAPIPDTFPISPNNLHFIVSLWKLYSLFFRVIYLFPLCMANLDCQIDCTQNQLRGIPLNCRWGN